jgi:guanine deaminase
VARLFPADESYAAVYDRHGLLGRRTLLAHALHLREEEWRLIAQRSSVVVHCPVANTFLRSGLFDLRAARAHNVRVALGSDIAAGCDVPMPRVARAMIEVAKLRQMTVDHQAVIPTPAEAWDLITRGNADALGWADAGRIEAGAAADLLVLRPEVPYDQHLIGRLIYGWRNDWIETKVLAGRLMA